MLLRFVFSDVVTISERRDIAQHTQIAIVFYAGCFWGQVSRAKGVMSTPPGVEIEMSREQGVEPRAGGFNPLNPPTTRTLI